MLTFVCSEDSSDWKDYGADALDAVITGLQEKGYEIVPISQLIYRDKYHMKADGTQVPGK